jgi:hypothetical protein
MVRMALEARVRDPADIWALLKVLSQSQGVLGMSLSAQTEGLDTEEQLLGGEGVEGRSEIAQDLHAGSDDEGDVAKGLEELEAVVALGGLVELGEASGVLAPVEFARVDNDTTDGGSVAADPLCGRVDDDVSAMVDGADEVTTGTKSVVNLEDISSYHMSWSSLFATYNHRNTLLVSRLGNSLQIRDVILGVSNTLNINSLCLVIDSSSNILRLVTINELGVDAQTREEDLELVVRAAVEVRSRDDVITSVSEGADGEELGSLA